ncbi:MAG: alpha/beta hydrolase [Marmoricola sp.]
MPAVAVAAVIALVAVGSVVLGGDGSHDSVRSRTAAVGDPEPLNRQVQIPATGDVNLSATLSLPPGSGPGSKLAGVVILAGFGPTNRDGTAPAGGVPDLLYRDVSNVLVENGMATLRYDKRGTGRTVLPDGEPLRVEDLVTDAAAAVKFLAERAEVDPDRIAVVGHEEGGLVAMALAASEPTVRGLGLISVPGRPLVDVLADDFAGSPGADDIPALRGVVATLLATGALPETVPSSLAGYFPVDNEKYLLDLFSADPVALAGQVQVPVLFLRGAEATLVTAADETALVGALGPDTETLVVPGAGPSLAIVDQAAPQASAEPGHGAPGTGHDAIGAAPSSVRSQAALSRLATFLADVTKV